MLNKPMKVGDTLSTSYGKATLSLYREIDQVYVLSLPFGTLYANKETILYTEAAEVSSASVKKAMELNDAYEALEKMRRLNLEVSCQECGVPSDEIDYEECTACLLEGAIAARANSVPHKMATFFRPNSEKIPAKMTRLKTFVAQREQKRKPQRCLTCGAPSCANHSSKTFRKEGITVCSECEKVFQMEFIIDCMTLDRRSRRKQVDKLIDVYDRAILLLQFSNQFIDNIMKGLRETKDRKDKINAGGSSVGITSGILGVAAAATLITPAGVPLLITSLVLGTSASVVQTGTEVKNKYFSEPNKLADRILALHGMLLSVLSVTGTLRDAATQDHIRTDAFGENSAIFAELGVNHIDNRTELLAGMTGTRFAVGSAEILGLSETAALAQSTRLFSSSGTAALRALRFARFAGGALAAATLVLEANSMAKIVQSIKEGSPCEKADSLQKIKDEIPNLPSTTNLDKECSAYLACMDLRGRKMEEEEAVKLLLEVSYDKTRGKGAIAQIQGDLILEGEVNHENSSPQTAEDASTKAMSGSLMERIQLYKAQQASSTRDK